MASFASGNEGAAVNQLNAFIQHVEAQRGHALTDAEADDLIGPAQAMIDAINSGGANLRSGEPEAVPDRYALEGNYPNPFSTHTTIRFGLPESAQVRLVVYDVLGRQVRVLLDGTREAGGHEVVFDTSDLPSGTYLYRLETPQGSYVRTMLLAK